MGFFKNIFKKKIKTTSNSDTESEKSNFMPEIKKPTDDRFVNNFINNGGKFLYSETINEAKNNLKLIFKENSWDESNILCLDNNVKSYFDLNYTFKREYKDNTNCLISSCEYLIADDGSILISSNQVAETKLADLPDDIIILAKTDQLINSISEGLTGIKNKGNDIPSNITNLKHFKSCTDKDFLSYGSSPKNLYLVLLENQ